jgi:hypothetical protein
MAGFISRKQNTPFDNSSPCSGPSHSTRPTEAIPIDRIDRHSCQNNGPSVLADEESSTGRGAPWPLKFERKAGIITCKRWVSFLARYGKTHSSPSGFCENLCHATMKALLSCKFSIPVGSSNRPSIKVTGRIFASIQLS